eukprot:bmy_20573T0
MEYATGREYLVALGSLQEKVIQVKFCQIESAIKYQHQKFIILDADMTTKIADLGFCIKFTFSNKLDTLCGSPLLCCPGTLPGPKV